MINGCFISLLIYDKPYDCPEKTNGTVERYRSYLGTAQSVSQKEIAAGCLIEAGSLTSILNRMEEKDLIERKILNGNRRTFHIFMTESGKKNQKLVEEAFKKIEKTALNGISEEEQKQFMDIFCRIYRNLADMK